MQAYLLFCFIPDNNIAVALDSAKYIASRDPSTEPVVETPSSNHSDSEGRITRTGCMVSIFKDGFFFPVLNNTSNRAGMVAPQVFSEWQAKEQQCCEDIFHSPVRAV